MVSMICGVLSWVYRRLEVSGAERFESANFRSLQQVLNLSCTYVDGYYPVSCTLKSYWPVHLAWRCGDSLSDIEVTYDLLLIGFYDAWRLEQIWRPMLKIALIGLNSKTFVLHIVDFCLMRSILVWWKKSSCDRARQHKMIELSKENQRQQTTSKSQHDDQTAGMRTLTTFWYVFTIFMSTVMSVTDLFLLI